MEAETRKSDGLEKRKSSKSNSPYFIDLVFKEGKGDTLIARNSPTTSVQKSSTQVRHYLKG
jgi:hypothetical protein